MGGKFFVKAAQHIVEGGARVVSEMPVLPDASRNNWIAINHFDADQAPMAGLGYKLYFEGGQVIKGNLDDKGEATHRNVPEPAVKVEYEESDPDNKPWPTFSQIKAELDSTKASLSNISKDESLDT